MLWWQLVEALDLMAREGLTHGDLSAYNLLVRDGRLILIDLPQVVDIVTNPRGFEFLLRDVHTVVRWFQAHGLPGDLIDFNGLVRQLRSAAGC